MIRTKGEAGTGDIVNAVTHMRSVFGGIRRLQSLRGEELYSEAKNLQAPVRARQVGGRERTAARRHVHRRRHRDTRGRVALHAARRRRRVRRLRDLQVRQSRRARARDRRGDDALPGRRRARTRLGGPRRGDGRHLDADARPEPAARDAAAGKRPSPWARCSLPGAAAPSAARSSRSRPRDGWQVRATWFSAQPALAAEWVQADVRDAEAVARATDGVDAVIHTAYRHHDDAWSTNVDGSEIVAAARGRQPLRPHLERRRLRRHGRATTPRRTSRPGERLRPLEGRGGAAGRGAHPGATIVRTSLLYGGADGVQERLAARGHAVLHRRVPLADPHRRSGAGAARAARARVSRAAARRRRRRRQPLRVRRAARCRRTPDRARPDEPRPCTGRDARQLPGLRRCWRRVCAACTRCSLAPSPSARRRRGPSGVARKCSSGTCSSAALHSASRSSPSVIAASTCSRRPRASSSRARISSSVLIGTGRR